VTNFSAMTECDQSDILDRYASLRPEPHAFTRAGAAHDLANYLQVISSALGIIERSLNHDALAALEPVVRGAQVSLERAACLSHQISRQRTNLRGLKTPIAVASRLIALQPLIALAAGPAVRVEYNFDDDAPHVLCDRDALDDAVMNLIVNANRAMGADGMLSIAVLRGHNEPENLPSTVLRVADTGCGMPAEMVTRVFEPEVTSKTNSPGSGLGLATVAAFARATGGSASVESKLGVGTIVSIELPGLLKSVNSCFRSRPVAEM
jgi:signal transduction histidine kinase